MKLNRFIFIFFGCLIFLAGSAQTISGTIVDAETGETLPFASITSQDGTVGTIANGDGYFQLQLPEELWQAPVVIGYLGYTSRKITGKELQKTGTVKLEAAFIQLEDLVIRPLGPEDYIKRVVNNFAEAYVTESYGTLAYYREKFKENNEYISFSEGVFKSYYPPRISDTLRNQHQLVLYREAANPSELQFMRETMEKKEKKRKKRAKRKGEEYKNEEKDFIHVNFGGPERILSWDITRSTESYLDSTKFRHYSYSFGTPVKYMNRELLVIHFKAKRTVDHTKQSGKIYIDPATDAITSIEVKGNIQIPLLAKPILLAMGLSVKEPVFHRVLNYRNVEGKWYPDYFFMDISAELTKRHFFSKNEISQFYIEQLFKVNKISATRREIEPAKRFKGQKPIEEQVFSESVLSWKDVNVLRDEKTR